MQLGTLMDGCHMLSADCNGSLELPAAHMVPVTQCRAHGRLPVSHAPFVSVVHFCAQTENIRIAFIDEIPPGKSSVSFRLNVVRGLGCVAHAWAA
jgi:hypothetical protein